MITVTRTTKTIMMSAVLVAAHILPTTEALALDRDDLIFHATFDKGLDADFAKGDPTAKAEGAAAKVKDADQGMVGRNGTPAAHFARRGDLLRFALPNNIDLAEGAVSFWVRELDRKPGQRVWNPYFQIEGENETLNILRLWQPDALAGGLWREGRKVAVAGAGRLDLTGAAAPAADEWFHLLFTWRGDRVSLYLNGELAATQADAAFTFQAPPASFTLGRPAAPTANADPFHTGEALRGVASAAKVKELKLGEEPYGAFLLDDVAVFNRFLGPDEVAALHAKSLDEALAAGVAPALRPTLDHGTPAAMPHEAWMDNTIGAEDVVLPGFEPLKADGARVQLWGRSYDFTDALMPRQIVNQGQAMLARPINWFVRVNGQDLPLTVEGMKLTAASDTRAHYEGQGTLGPLAVTARVMVEYDGFMKFDLAFAPGAEPTEIERLWMDIPLTPASGASMYHLGRRHAEQWRDHSVWDKDWRSALELVKTSAITLGTPDISLQWLTESDQHYFPRGNPEALATLEGKGARVFRNTVIGAPKRVDESFTLVFALHAGPVRPRPDNWRGWHYAGRRYSDPELHRAVAFSYFKDNWAMAPGDPRPREGFAVDRLKDRIEATSLHFAGFPTDASPDSGYPTLQKRFERDWTRLPTDISYDPATGAGLAYVDANSPWGQWYVDRIHRLFETTDVRGLFFDNRFPGVSANAAAGSGYVDEDGVRRPTWPLFGEREIQRRIYAIVKRARPDDGVVIANTSGIFLPLLSFCDMFLDEEVMRFKERVARPSDGTSLFDTFNTGVMRMIGAGSNYGPLPIYFTDPDAKRETWLSKQTRRYWAMLLTHDVHAASWVADTELLYLYLDLGYPLTDPGVVFHPYWENPPAARPFSCWWMRGENRDVDRASRLWASAYSKPDGSALVIVVRDAPNNYAGIANVEVKLDRKKLGLPDGPLASYSLESLGKNETQTSGRVEGDVLSVQVGGDRPMDDFTAVILRARPTTDEHPNTPQP